MLKQISLSPYPTPKLNEKKLLQMNHRFNCKTIQFLEEKVGKKCCDLRVVKGFLDRTKKTLIIK